MGIYVNIGNEAFLSSRKGEYVDKSGLIAVVNETLGTRFRFSCVSRCRRFGKSMAAEMLAAYYDKSCDSRSLFADLAIADDPSFEDHLNKYPVIYLDITGFITRFRNEDIVRRMDAELKSDVQEAYPNVEVKAEDDLMAALIRIAAATGDRFFFIIDEWDAICREFPAGSAEMSRYVDWLRRMFKDLSAISVFAGVYMTGILPIKKYKTQSALNNFQEYSMVDPGEMAPFFGFTKPEVEVLVARYGMEFNEMEKWYDGYRIGEELSMFNPNSVMQALRRRRCTSYWGKTATYDTIVPYIQMNYEGLKDDIIEMLAGGHCAVDPTGFQNDLFVVNSKDDVLTILIHLGYLSYDRDEGTCFIPNKEVAEEMLLAVRDSQWQYVTAAIEQSRQLLEATLSGDEESVARGVEAAHDENTSILSYNNENSLACVLSLAYYYARNNYVVHRELASGKGFADLVLFPRKNVDSTAIVIELKYNQSADTALDQIKRKEYPAKVAEYAGKLLLVGISYDRETKTHSCRIDRQ